MSATAQTIAATLRGKAAVNEVRELLDRLAATENDIALHAQDAIPSPLPYSITHEEVADVLSRRRDAVLRKLENKGIRVAPDPEPAAPPVYDLPNDAKASA